MRGNKSRWFGQVDRRNNDDTVEKIDEIRVERNQRKSRPKKKWTNVTRDYQKVFVM